jgi:hypothetical protein
MTELNGAESEEERIMAIIKIVLKLMKQRIHWNSWAVDKTVPGEGMGAGRVEGGAPNVVR